MIISPFIQGFGASGGLIVAIGAQNSFVLSQSVRGNHHFVVAMICILCDTTLITAGVAGVGTFVRTSPSLIQWVSWGGACFLFIYGCSSLLSAVKGGNLKTSDRAIQSLKTAIIATLGVSLLNPHVYLDTVILLGSISGRYHGDNLIFFWIGAVLASILWFICLSLGGRMLAPLFTKQLSWRILDTLVCATMWSIALTLATYGIGS